MCSRKKKISLVKIICLSAILSNNLFITRAQLSGNMITEGNKCITNDQEAGTCTNVRNCELWINKMRNHQYPKGSDQCGFVERDVIVCCPDRQESTDGPILLPDDDSNSEGTPCTMETDNGPGICKAIHRCEFRINQVRQGQRLNTREGHCSYDNFTEIVCCPTNERAASVEPPLSNVRPAERACLEYQEIVTGEDGLTVNQNVIGGENALLGEFPFMVALGYRITPEDPSLVTYICGGSLITERHVITAAHCIHNVNNFVPIEVRLGSVNLIDMSKDVQTIPIERSDIILHPRYTMVRNYFDIAIITMKQSVTFSNTTMPICLQTTPLPLLQTFLNSEMIATGWGVTNFNDDKPSENLKKTRQLSLIDRKTCTAQYQTSNRIPDGVDDTLFCILDENPENRSDTCQGDSGGPLFLKSTVVSSLIGIVSFGRSCASSVPGIYTNVYAHLDWIESIVWPSSQG